MGCSVEIGCRVWILERGMYSEECGLEWSAGWEMQSVERKVQSVEGRVQMGRVELWSVTSKG